MSESESSSGKENAPKRPVAPPLIFLSGLLAGILLNIVFPLDILANDQLGNVVGLICLASSAGLGVWAFRTMLRQGEQPDPRVETNAIVSSGPFASSNAWNHGCRDG